MKCPILLKISPFNAIQINLGKIMDESRENEEAIVNSLENITNASNVVSDLKREKLEEDVEERLPKRKKLDDNVGAIDSLASLCGLLETKTCEKSENSDDKIKSETVPPTKPIKKKKKKLSKDNKDKNTSSKEKKPNKNKRNLRKNIREILKDDELEAETRAAQQREIERVQRLQQQHRHVIEDTYNSDVEGNEENPAAALVENLQALAKELEDNSLSPELPIKFIEDSEPPVEEPSPLIETIKEELKESVEPKVENDDNDVICLSSDDEEIPPKHVPTVPSTLNEPIDDDDVVVLSGEEDKGDSNEEEDGDVNNFGLHTLDHLNQPDNEGRVLVNVGHPAKEPDIFLAPQLASAVKPHQIGGIRFLFDNVVESLEQFSISTGFGCILAHSMGLGKTFQIIAFCDVFLRHTTAKTALIIVPINTIQNWIAEFNSWLPGDDPRFHGQNHIRPRNFVLHVLNDTTKDITSRSKVINDWTSQGGVLLLGYEMYRLFYTQRQATCRQKKRGRKKKSPGVIDLEEEEKEKDALEKIYQALVDPGPDLVICDEGHRIKNMKASISVALKEIRTRRRIVLTGYPLQNNLLEYWCMVDFVRPNFLGTRAEFGNMFERPIQNGQCMDSSPADVKLMKERVYVLHSLVKGFVQRRSHAVLRSSLPHKQEHVLLLRMTPLQRALYRHYMSDLIQNKSVSNPLKAFAICCKIWNHPDILYNFLRKRDEDLDLDLDEVTNESKKRKGLPIDQTGLTPMQTPIIGISKEKKEEPSFDWANEMLKGYTPGDINSAAKMQVFFTILEESISIGDRLLVFSQSLFTLSLLEDYLQQRFIPGRDNERWAKNRSYFRLDGSTNAMDREKFVNEFNCNPDILLFLISTRAGSLGINLVGANRVVVFDASWNPCHDAQAVCRVYRYGQMKQCFIYRLVTDNSLEKKIYDRQINKQGTADRVVDELNPEVRLSLKDVTCLVCDDEDDPPEKDASSFSDHYFDPVLEKVIRTCGNRLTKDPFQHESLLVEGKESKLSKAEKRMAQRLYEKAKQDGATQYRRQSYTTFYPKIPIPPVDGTSLYNRNATPYYQAGINIRPGLNVAKPLTSPLPGLGIDILAEALAQGKLVCKEMVLTKDVTIARNLMGGAESSASTPIVLTSGTKVKLIKTPKGIYMQTPEGKIFRIHSSAPASPASPSAIAAALGVGLKVGSNPTSASSISEVQQKASAAENAAKAQKVISFSDKNTLLAQIRQNLTTGKNDNGTNAVAKTDVASTARKIHLTLPKNSDLSQFAKQLAALAKKSTTDSAASTSQSEDSSSSPKPKPSSLLDPKARALPSASLPKKVATVSPNLSKARVFTPARPTAAIEPISKPVEPKPVESSAQTKQPAEFHKADSNTNAITTAPAAAAAAAAAATATTTTTATATPNAADTPRTGFFDNLSLAAQLEGFASCTSSDTSSTAAAGNIKDLLKSGNNSASNENQTVNYPWPTENPTPNSMNYQWSDYPAWNPSWNHAYQWPNQWSQVGQPDFTHTVNNPTTDSPSSYNTQYSNFTGNQWPNFSTNSYPSHSPSTQYASNSFYSNSYFSANPSYNYQPQVQANYSNLSNYHQYNANYTPSYPQSYPDSFSQ